MSLTNENYAARASIEDEYARKLLALCRKPLGANETGTLRASLDSVRGETEAIGKTHSTIASQMKSELEEPLAAFAGGMKERRKIVQNGIEKLWKSKNQQTASVNKVSDFGCRFLSFQASPLADESAVARPLRARLPADQGVLGPRTHGHGSGRAEEQSET